MKLISIAAIGENNELGKNNDLVWHLPDDFKRFKAFTSGHHIIMGRKTFESFPKPLPNRTHIIITKQNNYNPEDCIVVHSIEEAIKLVNQQDEVFVIGGGEIYKQFMPYVDVLEITRVHASFDADTFFPEIDFNIFKLQKSEYHPKDEKHNYAFTYETYVRQ